MKKKKDGRVTVKSTSFKLYCILIAIVVVVIGSFFAIYYTMPRDGYLSSEIYFVLALATHIAVSSALLVAAVGITYKYSIQKPIENLTDAARAVAEGDFSVRLNPFRKDGKTDVISALYEDFNTMVEELASTEILKKDFVSNVSHELKTPLSVIQNLSAMLQSDGLSEKERKEYSVKIYDATKRLSSLVTDILQLSRLENQKIAADKADYNLSEQLCRCILNYEQVWEAKNIEINADLNQSIEIYSDESLMDIVWNNLLSNALKFTPQNGRINVSARLENGDITVTVEDSGCGMSAHDMKHMFDKFYQADASHATIGNGLGLALVKEILSLLKAEIYAESEQGRGTRFTVRLSPGENPTKQ